MPTILNAAQHLAHQAFAFPGSGITMADAEQMLASFAPLDFRPATNPAEQEAAYRVRYRCVIEQGWASPDELPDEMERDEHDEYATQILAWQGDRLAGTLRLVPPVPGRALPIEEDFGVRIEPVGQVVEGGRLVIVPAYRSDPKVRILRGLFTRFWIEVNTRGYSLAAFAAPARLARLYRWMGVSLEVIEPTRYLWGENRLLMLAAREGLWTRQ